MTFQLHVENYTTNNKAKINKLSYKTDFDILIKSNYIYIAVIVEHKGLLSVYWHVLYTLEKNCFHASLSSCKQVR
jgi:hypothetical protein